jgi:hypothetical protein
MNPETRIRRVMTDRDKSNPGRRGAAGRQVLNESREEDQEGDDR